MSTGGSDNTFLDVRPERAFRAGHAPGAVGIPLEEFAARVHEFPAAGLAVSIFDTDADRLLRAAEFLRGRGHGVSVLKVDSRLLSETGSSTSRLWSPNAFLVEAIACIRAQAAVVDDGKLRALDVACGTGRDAVYLAGEGYRVEAIDALPDAIERVNDLARRSGVEVIARMQDLEKVPALAAQSFQVVSVFRYLQRSLFTAIRQAVAPGGFVVYETFHIRNRQTGCRPSNPDHLLEDGELAAAFEGFQIMVYREGIERDGRFFSSLLACAPH